MYCRATKRCARFRLLVFDNATNYSSKSERTMLAFAKFAVCLLLDGAEQELVLDGCSVWATDYFAANDSTYRSTVPVRGVLSHPLLIAATVIKLYY